MMNPLSQPFLIYWQKCFIAWNCTKTSSRIIIWFRTTREL